MVKNKEISALGMKEKYIRKGHYNSIKVWWARRPIIAMRALILNELNRKKEVRRIPDELVRELNPADSFFQKFAEDYGTHELKLLDVFSGGGAIPFESARLGLKTYAAELNPVASLLQETIFESLPIENYPSILKDVAYEIISKAEERLKSLYFLQGSTSYVIFWGRTANCKSCGENLSLGRLKYLAKKKKKEVILDKRGREYGLSISENPSDQPAQRNAKTFVCDSCDTHHSFADIKAFCSNSKLGEEPMAMCYHKNGKKTYLPVSEGLRADIKSKTRLLDAELSKLSYLIPKENVLAKSGVINPTLYDLKTPSDFFNKRQLACLLVVCDEIINAWQPLLDSYGRLIAKQITLGLTALIEFLVDWNSKSTMWISQNEQTGRSLVGPGVGMKWDYIEINPFYASGSNLRSKIDRVVNSFSQIRINNTIRIINGSSTSLPLDDESIDLVVTDPPYYDSVDYTALSEFFRPWFEVIINSTYDNGRSLKNDTSKEAIVALSKERKNLQTGAHYQKTMTEVLVEVDRVLKKDGSCLLLYSHKTLEGWEVISEAFKSAGLVVDHIDALNMERKARPRAMSYQALNGVVVFRLIKKEATNQFTSKNLSISSLVANGDLDESNIPIYLAANACKKYTQENDLSFKECYGLVIAAYQRSKLKEPDCSDVLSRAYLKAFVLDNLDLLDRRSYKILNENNLLNENKTLKLVLDINPSQLTIKSSALSEIVSLFKSNKYNSKTQILLDQEIKNVATQFCSIVGGHKLNTVKERSSLEEQKIARLILSKVC